MNRYSVLGTRYSVLGTRYSVLGTRYSVPGTWYLVPGTWSAVVGSKPATSPPCPGGLLLSPRRCGRGRSCRRMLCGAGRKGVADPKACCGCIPRVLPPPTSPQSRRGHLARKPVEEQEPSLGQSSTGIRPSGGRHTADPPLRTRRRPRWPDWSAVASCTRYELDPRWRKTAYAPNVAAREPAAVRGTSWIPATKRRLRPQRHDARPRRGTRGCFSRGACRRDRATAPPCRRGR